METKIDHWKAFGKWLQEEREKTNVTQEMVAKETEMNVKSVSRIERGEGGTKRKTVLLLVEAINKLSHGYKIDPETALRNAGFVSTGQTALDEIVERLAGGAMASGLDDLTDQDLREAFFEDMRTIGESMLRRRLDEQKKRSHK